MIIYRYILTLPESKIILARLFNMSQIYIFSPIYYYPLRLAAILLQLTQSIKSFITIHSLVT
ncbi:hypothetical protein BpHYR1_014555 [Brachionus plicatilis]|uniref:Uncharacterized protein n=1 Tax=Brachionus plicatilis TaxID=10195 RepID=A0A3M7PT96_BRAPC|nr:hypothetical protein BpHYR1_014555 [Brachionus plicatilis]